MFEILTVAKFEIKSLIREKIIYIVIGVFLFLSASASFIGWATLNTSNNIYIASISFLTKQGVTQLPANPLVNVSNLSTFNNLIIYFSLIGALLSIVIGFYTIIRERKSGMFPLILSRPIAKTSIILGKILGLSGILVAVLLITLIMSVATNYILPIQHLVLSQLVNLIIFFILSFSYMIFFGILGMAFSIFSKNESMALFLPICIWSLFTFVLPEITTGLNPVALLNPVNLLNIKIADPFYIQIDHILHIFSLSTHYYTISGEILNPNLLNNSTLFKVLSNRITELFTILVSIFMSSYIAILGLENYHSNSDNVTQ